MKEHSFHKAEHQYIYNIEGSLLSIMRRKSVLKALVLGMTHVACSEHYGIIFYKDHESSQKCNKAEVGLKKVGQTTAARNDV